MGAGATIVERRPTEVRYLECADALTEIPRTWRALEDHFQSLSGHRFLATFDPAAGWYRACVVATPEADLHAGHLPLATVPGGPFARLRLKGDPSALYGLLPAAFANLEAVCDVDPGRPRIEYYRRRTEVHVLVPVREPSGTS